MASISSMNTIKLHRRDAISFLTKSIAARLYAIEKANTDDDVRRRVGDHIDFTNKATRLALRVTNHVKDVMFQEEKDCVRWMMRYAVCIYFDDGMTIVNHLEVRDDPLIASTYAASQNYAQQLMDIDEDMAVKLLLKYGGDNHDDQVKRRPP